MDPKLTRLAAAAESVARKLRAAGEEDWAPLLHGLASRLQAGDASAALELLEMIQRPGGLGALELGPDNARFLTAGDAKTVNRQLRRHIDHLNLLARSAEPDRRGHDQDDSAPLKLAGQDASDSDEGSELDCFAAVSPGRADQRTMADRYGRLPRGRIDWMRVIVQGIIGLFIGGVAGGFAAFDRRFVRYWLPDADPVLLILCGAVLGGLYGAVIGWGPRIIR